MRPDSVQLLVRPIRVKGKHGVRTMQHSITLRRLLVTKLAAARTVALRITLPVQVRRAITRALARRQQVTLTLTGIASARGATSGTAQVTIRLRR